MGFSVICLMIPCIHLPVNDLGVRSILKQFKCDLGVLAFTHWDKNNQMCTEKMKLYYRLINQAKVWITLAKIKTNEKLISKRTVSNNTWEIAMKTVLTLAFSDLLPVSMVTI